MTDMDDYRRAISRGVANAWPHGISGAAQESPEQAKEREARLHAGMLNAAPFDVGVSAHAYLMQVEGARRFRRQRNWWIAATAAWFAVAMFFAWMIWRMA